MIFEVEVENWCKDVLPSEDGTYGVFVSLPHNEWFYDRDTFFKGKWLKYGNKVDGWEHLR